LQGLRDKAELQPGQRVLIHGASGGVGSYAVPIAKQMGAYVCATASANKLDYVRRLGADRVMDYKTTALSNLADNFDVVLDAAAKSSYFQCRHLLSPKGRYVGLLPNLSILTGKMACLFSQRACRAVMVRSLRADLETVGHWLAEGRFAGVIDTTYALTDITEALHRLQSGDTRGKIAIAVAA
jgi:NADPH:quinone reductase-like Zn-dependent oxidoreductase